VKPLLVVRHEKTAPLGILEREFERENIAWRYHDCWTAAALPDIADVSGLVVLGGSMNADEFDDYPYLLEVRRFMKAAVEKERPVLGICLGAQMLGRALDAAVYPSPRREIGFVNVRVAGKDDDLLAPFAPSSRVFQFHEDTVSLPPDSELLFTGDDIEVQAFRVGARAYGVQFHFEVTMAEVEAWCDEVADLEAGWGMSKESVLQQAQAELEPQQEKGREVARRFAALLRS
jgi:GMP synthase-like glutamine amidotransferase